MLQLGHLRDAVRLRKSTHVAHTATLPQVLQYAFQVEKLRGCQRQPSPSRARAKSSSRRFLEFLKNFGGVNFDKPKGSSLSSLSSCSSALDMSLSSVSIDIAGSISSISLLRD